jgi:hypothetical protein
LDVRIGRLEVGATAEEKFILKQSG